MDRLTRWIDQRVVVFGAAVGDQVVRRSGMDEFMVRLSDQFGAFLLGLNDQLHNVDNKEN